MITIGIEAYIILIADSFEISADIVRPFEEESSPVLELPLSQVLTWLRRKMRSPTHLS
jgi:hypothetical protein